MQALRKMVGLEVDCAGLSPSASADQVIQSGKALLSRMHGRVRERYRIEHNKRTRSREYLPHRRSSPPPCAYLPHHTSGTIDFQPAGRSSRPFSLYQFKVAGARPHRYIVIVSVRQ